MGIDARMFVRVRGASPSEQELRQIAARMCSRLGVERFLIMRGDETWHDGRQRHALSIVTETAGEARKDYAPDGEYEGYLAGLKALDGVPDDRPVIMQDGPPLVAVEGEFIVQAHMWTRYYGKGYERGDWPTIRATAEYLEAAFPQGEVWYGGDSSGVCAELFDSRARDALNRHFLMHGHEPYRSYFGSQPKAESCDFCGGRHMNECGGGQGRTFWQCDGCGLERITGPDGSRDLPKTESFFGPKSA